MLQAQRVVGKGTASFIKSNVQAVPGVQSRLVSVLANGSNWEVIVGGGDPYAVAYAIYSSVLDISSIVGSATSARNVTSTIVDSPNSYDLTYVNPPMQNVQVSVVWNASWTNFSGATSVNQLAAVAIQGYINNIIVGQPINLLEMTNVFQESVIDILSLDSLTALTFTVKINGVVTAPSAGTDIIYGDSESYFYSGNTDITVTQG